MAATSTVINARPEDVWAVLSDPSAYARWVVGAKRIRDADPGWPAPGSAFHHTVGVGPFAVKDNTKSVEVDAPRRLLLDARARPFGRATVEIRLQAVDGFTRVDMVEHVSSPALMRAVEPVLDPLIHLRNAESLRRLSAAVRERSERDG